MGRPPAMKNNPTKKKTRTSAFGTPGRISHDASPFYASKLYSQVSPAEACEYIENEVPPEFLNTVMAKSSESMAEIPDHSVHLMVTSPPYNVGKDYDEDLTLEDYLEFLQRVWQEVHRVLVPGGRACVNIANLGRKPYIPLHAYIVQDMTKIGFLMRGRNHLAQRGQLLALHRLGQLAVAGQPDAPGCPRIYSDLLQGGVFPPEPRKAAGHHHPGGISGAHQERLDLPGSVGPVHRPPGAVSGGPALSPYPALYL